MQQARLAVEWACNRVIILLEASGSWCLQAKYNENDIQASLIFKRY